MYWSSAAAPLYTTFNGYGVLRTTPTISAANAISTQTYKNLPTGSDPYSVVAVFKPNSVEGHRFLVTAGLPESSPYSTLINPIAINPASKYVGGCWGSLGTWLSHLGSTPTTDHYVMMVTTFNGSTEKVYINNVFEKAARMTPGTFPSIRNTAVIGMSSATHHTMNADVGLVLMYNRSLSSSEVTQMYSTYANRFVLPTSGISTVISTELVL